MSIPLSLLGKQLESAQGFEFELILRALKSDEYADQNLLKSDLSIFVSKVLKLLKSEESDFHVWKACHLANVLCTYNPVVLCSYAGMFLDAMFLKLESLNYETTIACSYGKELYKTLILSLDTLMSLIRGKPALTRESLTPKLPAIINLLVNLSPNEPEMVLPVLQKIILKNNTTFRPYVTKFHGVIKYLILEKFHFFNAQTQRLICDIFAYLHLFKLNNFKDINSEKDANKQHQKQNPAFQWNYGILNIITEFKPILELMGQLLDFDEQILTSLKNLPSLSKTDEEKKEGDEEDSNVKSKNEYLKFPSLNLDLNEPLSLWEINERLDTLCKLLQSFITLPTPFQIRIPLFKIVKIGEILLSLNTTFLPLQKGLRRDDEVTSVINTALPQLQYKGAVLFDLCLENYESSCLPFLSTIFFSLQQFIPYYNNKNKKINPHKCAELRNQFITIFHIISQYLRKYVGKIHPDETEVIAKFVDIALILLEKDSSLSYKFIKTVETKNQISKQNKKQIKRQNALMGSMSDLYSHSYQFVKYSPDFMFDVVNDFLSDVLKFTKLPSTQQVKIINYAVAKSVEYKDVLSFKELLKTLVVYPGNERVSILPIAATILKDDEYMKLLSAPKLPSNYIQHYNMKNVGSSNKNGSDDQESDDEDDQPVDEIDEIDELMIPVVQEPSKPEAAFQAQETPAFAENQILKRKIEQEEVNDDNTKKIKITETVSTSVNEEDVQVQIVEEEIVETVEEQNAAESESDSDFEMPEIDIS